MRLSALFIRLAVFFVAALICVLGARIAVATVETRSVEAVRMALEERGQDFATVIGDGLQVILEGEAPTEVMRFRAMSAAGSMVEASRVIDNMSVTNSAGIQPPEFSMEILRNDSGVSVIGLVPAASNHEGLGEELARIAGENGTFSDLLETADFDVPQGWERAATFALRALRQLPRSKISVRSGRVTIEAISDSPEQKAQLEASLRRNVPEGLTVRLEISAPRPVVSPFVTRFIIDGTGARFDSCVADTLDAERLIIEAARAAGVTGRLGCTVALGAPTSNWADAVTQSIQAVAEMGGGTVTLSDADVTFVALPGAVQGKFDRISGELKENLPDLFALKAILPPAPVAGNEGPSQFTATLSPEGLLQLRGLVSGDQLNTTAANFASAKFGAADIAVTTQTVEGLPNDWTIRILAGIEALSKLSNGAVTVQPDTILVRGNTGNRDATGQISRMLIDKLGDTASFEVEVTYVEQLDPIAALPTPAECLERIGNVTQNRKISFDPGSSDITGEAVSVMDDIAEILRRCSDLRMEIAGYTDSQGSESGNQRLSQQRANAVLEALRMRRVPVSTFQAIGYGEADPIADNATEEGREANRRIEFSLIQPETTEEPTALEQIEAEAEIEADDADTGEDNE